MGRNRREFLSTVGTVGIVGTTSGLAAASRRSGGRNSGRRTSGDRSSEEEQLIDISVTESQDQYRTGIITTTEGEYAYYVDKSDGTVRVNAEVSTDDPEEVRAQGITGDLIVVDNNEFNRNIGSCSVDGDCIHMFSGGSVKINQYLAGASKALIIAAAIGGITARIPIGALRTALSFRKVSTALGGAVGSDFGGNWVTLATYDHDRGGTKKKATGVALTRTENVSTSQVRSIDFVSGEHWGCDPVYRRSL